MPDMMRDGTGQGYLAKVDSENRLSVFANTMDLAIYECITKGEMYCNILAVTPAGAGDCFLYMANTRSNYNMVLGKITILTPGIEIVDAKRVTGTPAGGTSFTPVNRNLNYQNSAIGTFQYGTNITGLTGTDVLSRFYSTANLPIIYDIYHGVIIPPNSAVGFYATNGSIKVDYTVVWYYVESGII
jgi:hypothetical protein